MWTCVVPHYNVEKALPFMNFQGVNAKKLKTEFKK